LQGRGVAPIRQEDGHGRARGTAEFAVDLVKRRERQKRRIDETVVGAELLWEFKMSLKKCQRRGSVELIPATGRIGGQDTCRAGLFTSGRYAVEYLLDAAKDRPHQVLERYSEAGAAGGPIEEEQGHCRRAERVLALTDRKAHLVGLDAELLGKRLAQRDNQRMGACPAQRVLRLKLEDIGRSFQAESEVALDAERLVVARTQVLSHSVAQWFVVNECRRGRRPATLAICFRPTTLQTNRIAESAWAAAIGIVDKALPAAPVTPKLRHR
jgi:hypothetical protein